MNEQRTTDLRLSDSEQARLYEYCRYSPEMYSLVRRLAAHGLQPDPPYEPEPPTWAEIECSKCHATARGNGPGTVRSLHCLTANCPGAP